MKHIGLLLFAILTFGCCCCVPPSLPGEGGGYVSREGSSEAPPSEKWCEVGKVSTWTGPGGVWEIKTVGITTYKGKTVCHTHGEGSGEGGSWKIDIYETKDGSVCQVIVIEGQKTESCEW